MRIARRFAGVGAAVLLCPYAASAVADPSPAPTPSEPVATIDCPADDVVAATLGRQITGTVREARECQYSASGAGVVRFQFETHTLLELRAEAEAAGSDIKEVPELGADAFAGAVGNSWTVRFPVGLEAATLGVPPALQSGAIALAEEMQAAGSPRNEPTPSPGKPADDRPGMPGTGN